MRSRALKIEQTEGDGMKFKHTYCFYMTNGEHLMIDADGMTICDNYIRVCRDKDGGEVFMVIYKKDLMAWEVAR